MKKAWIIIPTILIVIFSFCLLALKDNKTFYKTTYNGVFGEKIFIPKYSYFDKECCMTAASFYSLKSKKCLEKEIDNYLKDFTYFEDEETYGYQLDDLFIQSYIVEEKGLYRKIIITY